MLMFLPVLSRLLDENVPHRYATFSQQIARSGTTSASYNATCNNRRRWRISCCGWKIRCQSNHSLLSYYYYCTWHFDPCPRRSVNGRWNFVPSNYLFLTAFCLLLSAASLRPFSSLLPSLDYTIFSFVFSSSMSPALSFFRVLLILVRGPDHICPASTHPLPPSFAIMPRALSLD